MHDAMIVIITINRFRLQQQYITKVSQWQESWRHWAVHLRPAIQLIHVLVAYDFTVGGQHLPFIGVCVIPLTSVFFIATQGIDETFMEMDLAIESLSDAHL